MIWRFVGKQKSNNLTDRPELNTPRLNQAMVFEITFEERSFNVISG